MGVDSVLYDEKKSSTYKFALMAAITDYILENPNEYTKNGMHYIPLIYLAKRWLYYYGPMMLWSDNGISQMGGSRRLAVKTLVDAYLDSTSNPLLIDNQPSSILKLKDHIESNLEMDQPLVKLLVDIRSKIIEQPLRYIKVSDNNLDQLQLAKDINIKQSSFTLFGLLNTELPISEQDDYEEVRKQSTRWGRTSAMSYLELESSETVFIQMGHYTYIELARSRLFLKDAIIKRWLEYSIENYIKNDPSETLAMFECLKLHERIPERNSSQMTRFREIANLIFDPMECIYCEDQLSSFELDHFIPWSKLPINRFWNLFPSCKTCNGKKTDHIIAMEDTITKRLQNYLQIWLEYIGDDMTRALQLGGSHMLFLEGQSPSSRVDLLFNQLKEINEKLV